MNKKIILTLIAVVAALTSMAQGRMDMCINEVMVQGDSISANQNGKCSAWIELFNSSYGTNAIENNGVILLACTGKESWHVN